MAPDARGDAAVSVLKGRFKIWPESPLPELDSPRAGAFAARDLHHAGDDVFALVCEPDLPQRSRALQRLVNLSDDNLLRLLDHGLVSWTPSQGSRFVLIYDRPPGRRLVSDLRSQSGPMSEYKVIIQVLTPIAKTIAHLAERKITHRAIRPTNMFLGGDEQGVILGECASVPSAFDQPPAFETIESLMADPSGRGAGHLADDIYALGVSILALVTGGDPAAGRGAAQLLAEKMTKGSYHTLVGTHRLPQAIRDVLHGLLEDRAHARWGLEALGAWLEDREAKPARPSEATKPERGFSFGGNSFHNPRALATAMAVDWEKVALKDGGHDILAWARQSLGDDAIANRVLTALELSKRDRNDGEGVANPALVARMCMALDNQAPLRYKRVSAHVDGLGTILAARYSDQNFLRDASEVFRDQLPGAHVRMVHGTKGNGPAMARALSRFGYFIQDGGLGAGIERCLYELNPSQYCHSPLIADQKVMQIADLLPALERAARLAHKGPPMDRHIAAFIAAHAESNIDNFLKGLNKNNSSDEVALGMLGLLATVGVQTKAGHCPKLAHWIAAHLSPAVDCYHNRVWRAQAKAELPGVIESGDIVAIYAFLDNGEARQRDREGYAAAVSRCQKIDGLIAFLGSPAAKDPKKEMEYGHGLAVMLSAVVGLGAIATTLALVL